MIFKFKYRHSFGATRARVALLRSHGPSTNQTSPTSGVAHESSARGGVVGEGRSRGVELTSLSPAAYVGMFIYLFTRRDCVDNGG